MSVLVLVEQELVELGRFLRLGWGARRRRVRGAEADRPRARHDRVAHEHRVDRDSGLRTIDDRLLDLVAIVAVNLPLTE